MKDITIASILKGCTPGRMQSVGYIQVIPLISDIIDESFSSPVGNIEASTSDYGTLNLKRTSNTPTIFPTGGSVVSTQKAQNHASPKGIYLSGKGTYTTKQARCIQDSQGGYIRAERDYHFSVIPWAIREFSMSTKDKTNYSELWPALKEFNQELGLLNRGHLEYFLEQFKDQLDTFCAEFEVVPKMVGAIILLNGDVIGVERTPNYNFWKSMWKPLIRESYGSVALWFAKHFSNNPPVPKMRIPLASAKIQSIKDILPELLKVEKQEEVRVKNVIKGFIKSKFQRKVEQQENDCSFESLENKQFVGQALLKDDGFPYVSLTTTNVWLKNPNAAKFANAADFSM